MLVMEAPQFPIKDDSGHGDGISAIPQWQLASTDGETQDANLKLNITPTMSNILSRLRNIFHHAWHSSLTNTQLHDLTCFVMHKLLLLPPFLDADANQVQSAASESLRYATALYMLILHGTTYYSHVGLANAITLQLKCHLAALLRYDHIHDPLGIWVISVGLVATVGTRNHEWFTDQASVAAAALGLKTWEDVLTHLQSILWVRVPQEELFRQEWEEVFKMAAKGG